MSNCLICKSEFTPFVDFGDMPIANAFAKKEDLIALEMFPINLIKNGEKLGVFFVEEGFTNELLEKNNIEYLINGFIQANIWNNFNWK